MGYMEGNMGGIDYTYGGGTSHYPLWKPPSGYFPRGEAPPPYEEAVAISQAEALSAQCTVNMNTAGIATQRVMGIELSAATAAEHLRRGNPLQQGTQGPQQLPNTTTVHHHHLPTTTLTSTPVLHQHQSNQITQSTTNLINININSGGNVTTIATGENHQLPYSSQTENSSNATAFNTIQAIEPLQMASLTAKTNSSTASSNANVVFQPTQQSLQSQPQFINSNSINGRLQVTPNNSICVQTIATAAQFHHHPQQQLAPTNNFNNAIKTHQNQQQQQQQKLQSNCQALQVTTTTTTSTDCGFRNCHLNVNTTANISSNPARRSQRGTLMGHSKIAASGSQDMLLQQYVTMADVEINPTTGVCFSGLSTTGSVGDFELIASPSQFANSPPTPLTAAISTPVIDEIPKSAGEIATISSNTGGSITQANLGIPVHHHHHTLPTHSHAPKPNCNNNISNANSAIGSKTPSSSRRYHRTIPRYFAVVNDHPLTVTATTTARTENNSSQNARTDIKSSRDSSANSTNSNSNTKKPTCQCPVQHIPMSYMAANQLTHTQSASNSAFLSVLSNKLTSSASSSSSTHSSVRSNNGTHNSLGNLQPKKTSTLQHQQLESNDTSNASGNTLKRSSNSSSPYRKHESKISTISKQVTDVAPELRGIVIGHHHHQQHEYGNQRSLMTPDESTPIVLGRTHKRLSNSAERSDHHTERNERVRSSSSGSTRHVENSDGSSVSSVVYLSGKVDAHLSVPHSQYYHHSVHKQQQESKDYNPVLPPKLHKSLTNLQNTTSEATSTNTTATSSNKVISSSGSNSTSGKIKGNSNSKSVATTVSATTGVQTSYMHNRPKSSSLTSNTTSSSIILKDQQESKKMTPLLTLPPVSSTSLGAVEKATKINSTTFYPLQNNHATYTLPKHISGKSSLNNTIANVVSKVPSVINIPINSGGDTLNNNNNVNLTQSDSIVENGNSNFNATSLKCSTLPKILRTKKLEGSSKTASCSTASKCKMPVYPLYPTSSSASLSTTVTTSNKSSNTLLTGALEKHLPVCTTSKNCLNPKEHFLPNDTSLDDDYLSECENCKIAQSAKYYLDTEDADEAPQETMTLQRKSMDDNKEEQDQTYYRISHTLPTNSKKNVPSKNNNREPWFSTIPASSSSDDDANE